MWIRVPRNIFLICGAILGLAATTPLVLRYATVWWWLSVPVVAAYAVVLWRWGLDWVTDDAADDASIPVKIAGVLILLGYSFVGLVLLIYLGLLAVQYWMLIAFSLLVVVAFVVVMWLSGALKDKPDPAKAPPTAIIDGAQPKPDDLVR